MACGHVWSGFSIKSLLQIKAMQHKQPKTEPIDNAQGVLMLRLAAVLYILIASALGGAAVIVVLTLNMLDGWQIAGAFLVGCLLSFPASWLLARKIYGEMNGPRHV